MCKEVPDMSDDIWYLFSFAHNFIGSRYFDKYIIKECHKCKVQFTNSSLIWCRIGDEYIYCESCMKLMESEHDNQLEADATGHAEPENK